MRAVALLSVWKLKNSLRTIVTDPRKLIPTLIAFAYFGGVFFLFSVSSGAPRPSSRVATVPLGPWEAGVFLAFVMVAITVIDNGLGDNLLAFPPPDVDYIFPSPISRRVVLAYRLPALTFGASFLAGLFLFIYRFAGRAIRPQLGPLGDVSTSKWMVVGAAVLCVGIYMNFAMFIAIRFEKRQTIHRALMAFLIGLVALVCVIVWQRGISEAVDVVGSRWLRWTFLPADLVARVITMRLAHLSTAGPMLGLLGLYGISLVPMFATNANFYESSIASSERFWAARRAMRGGFAAMMAARASKSRYRSRREYTLPPFGAGATALLWAHLCAAWKRPYANFVTPVLGGIAIGIIAGFMSGAQAGAGYGAAAVLVMYSSFGFMAAARTASEAAVRRRELIATLPIPGWQAVAANMGVPVLSLLLLCLGVGAAYAIMGGSFGFLVFCAVAIFFPLRMFARMLIVYMLVLAYPDFADKLQQFFAQMIYYLFGAPLFIGEVVLCIPAIFLRSLWLGLATLVLYEVAIGAFLLLLAGRVAERAVAAGEPVRFWNRDPRAR